MILNIKQFRYATDNFGYVVYGNDTAVIIDGGAVEPIFAFIDAHAFEKVIVTNTHAHPDHTTGNRMLLEHSGLVYLDHRKLRDTEQLAVDRDFLQVWHTPGHTSDSVTFKADTFLITGDTLFNGTVGNCFSGDLKSFYHSIKKIMALPPETIVYAGHDYVHESMAVARQIEPANPHIDHFLQNYNPDHVFSTLSDEVKINPYIRFNDPKIIAILNAQGAATDSEYECWEALMTYF